MKKSVARGREASCVTYDYHLRRVGLWSVSALESASFAAHEAWLIFVRKYLVLSESTVVLSM